MLNLDQVNQMKLLFIIFVTYILFEYYFLCENSLNDETTTWSSCISQDSENKTRGKYVVMSINLDTNLDFYSFYLPIICLSWRKLVNFEPIVLGVVNKNKKITRLTQKTLEYLKILNVTVVQVETVPEYDKMTGMLSRLFIGAIDNNIIKDNDFVFSTDSDLIPFRKKYFDITDFESIILLDAFRFGKFRYKQSFYSMYSMQYIGMSKCRWRDVMRLNQSNLKLDGKSILKLVKNIYGESNVKQNEFILRGDSTWWLDQKMVSIHIDNYLKFNQQQKVISRPYDGIKLDRIYSDKKWLNTFNKEYDSIIDSHLFHDNYIQKLHFIRLIMSKQLDTNMNLILNRYIDEFMKIKNEIQDGKLRANKDPK